MGWRAKVSEGTELRGRGAAALRAHVQMIQQGQPADPLLAPQKWTSGRDGRGSTTSTSKILQGLKIVVGLVSNGMVTFHRQGQKALADTLEAALVVGCSGLPLAARHRSTDGRTERRASDKAI